MNTHNIHFQNKRSLIIPYILIHCICSYGKNLGTPERVRDSHGKRAISVRAIKASV